MKIRVNPIEKHVNLIFSGKFVVIFFKASLTRVKKFKGPLFASGLLTSVCDWSLNFPDSYKYGMYEFHMLLFSETEFLTFEMYTVLVNKLFVIISNWISVDFKGICNSLVLDKQTNKQADLFCAYLSQQKYSVLQTHKVRGSQLIAAHH